MNIQDFMEVPTKEQWDAEIDAGWAGPDGSSMSTDHVNGVRIGITDPDYRFHRYPANLHDWRYRLGRKHKLPGRFRHAADVEYRQGCINYINLALDGRIFIGLGVLRSWVRYYALRLFGWKAWCE